MSAPAKQPIDQLIGDKLAAWTAGLRLSEIPEAAIHEAKRSILDVVGVTFAGAAHPTAVLARGEVEKEYRSGPGSLIGGGEPVSTTGAAFANGVAAHVWDYDDVSLEGMVHATAAVWPAALAVAEANETTGADLLTSFIAEVEAEYALGRAFTPDLFFRGWWTTGLLGSIGAAVGAGRAMGLDASAMAQAIRIAAAQATGPYVLVGTPIKPYACGRAAEAGVQAAKFAAAGLSGPDDVFENQHGFTAMFGDDTILPGEMAKIGTRYVLEASRLTFKRYPVCAGAQGSVEAVLDLVAEHQLSHDQIVRVRCEVTPAIGHYMQYRVPNDITEAQFSLPYCVAAAIRFGTINFDHLTEAAIADPVTLAMLAKIDVDPSPKLESQERDREDYVEPVVATINTVDGRELRRLNPAPIGTPQRPIGDRELEKKFHACVENSLGRDEADDLIERIWRLETLPSALALLHATR